MTQDVLTVVTVVQPGKAPKAVLVLKDRQTGQLTRLPVGWSKDRLDTGGPHAL